jgi:predicted RNA-binding Zn-ribbon protein involved in translation (DUF1610 family)
LKIAGVPGSTLLQKVRERMSNKCPKCGSRNLVLLAVFRNDLRDKYHCSDCGYNFFYPQFTLFDCLTVSPVVLAEKLVYCNVQVKTTLSTSLEQPGSVELTKGWYSTIIRGKVWSNESEAFDATVAKLKEIYDEQ